MDSKPIDGFVRRPKILPEIIIISDGDSDGESTAHGNVNMTPVVKCEANKSDETASEISTSDIVPNDGKKRRKKKERNKRREKRKKKSKRKFKKENYTSDESYSDSDSSSDGYKRRAKNRSQNSSSTSSSTDSDSDSDSSDHDRKRKRSRHRSKLSSRSRRDRKNKKRHNFKRLKREKITTDENTNSKGPSQPDNFISYMVSNSPHQNNSNLMSNGSLGVMDVEAGASTQNYTCNSFSHYDSSMSEITSNFNVTSTMTANGNGYGTQTLDKTVLPKRYVDDGQIAATSRQSATSGDDGAGMEFVYDVQDNTTQISAQNYPIVENYTNDQSFLSHIPPIEHNSEPPNDQNNFLQFIASNESDDEQQDEQLTEINGQHSGGRKPEAINLQRPRPNTDKMLHVTNPARANVCVICYDSFTNIVNHYKKKHSTEEVYVSRISPKMAHQLKSDDFKRFGAKCEKRGSFWKLYAKCFFCEYPRSFNLSYWIDHIRIHTGEYARMCTSCGANVTAHGHCGSATDLTGIPRNLATTDLMCFVCKFCNFVQIERTNMHLHLIKQHHFHKNELESKYEERMLVPSKNTVFKEASTIAQLFQRQSNETVPINQQENAHNIRVIDEIFLGSFNNAPESNAPEPNVPESNVPEPNESAQNETKREIDWEKRLEAIYPRYIRDDNNEIVVNPWLENKTRKTTIFPANLFDFYKCMHPNCIFSTSKKIALQQHIKDHYAHHDVGSKRGDPIDIHKRSRNCPYCYLGPFKSVNVLWDHMEKIHSSCTYQCSHCYYRCIEMDSIVLHYEKFHPNEEKNIYIVNTERKFGGDQMDRMSDEECVFTQFHEFECSYCNEFESSKVVEMRNHLAEHHSSEFMFVLRRGKKDEYIYVGAMSQWKEFKFFKCGTYKEMSQYLDCDEQNHTNQPNPFPLVQVFENDFGFEPSKLQIAEDVKFEYRNFADYKNSQKILFRCGRFSPEFLIENPEKRGNCFCGICYIYVESNDKYLCHLKEHQKTDCYFIAEREDLILQHMRNKHSNHEGFCYRKCERKQVKHFIKCIFACGICSNEKFLCLRKVREHHKVCHPHDVEVIQIDRLLNGDERKILNEKISFKAYKFCAEQTVDNPIGKPECSIPMTEETLKQHHARYHASNDEQRYKHKLVLCINNKILPIMPTET